MGQFSAALQACVSRTAENLRTVQGRWANLQSQFGGSLRAEVDQEHIERVVLLLGEQRVELERVADVARSIERSVFD